MIDADAVLQELEEEDAGQKIGHDALLYFEFSDHTRPGLLRPRI
jgi:hypothetical protein